MLAKEILEEAKNSIIDADEEKALEIVKSFNSNGEDLIELLQEGFSKGNLQVGNLFEKGEISLPELIFCTEVMKRVIEKVAASTALYEGETKGKILIATVAGDVHEIGKGIVASTMKGYGLEVIDIGREVPVNEIIKKAKEHDVDIIATSALLTSTLQEQKKLEEALKEQGLKERFHTMVGGAPCTLRWAKRIGANEYSEDAIDAAEKALKILETFKV